MTRVRGAGGDVNEMSRGWLKRRVDTRLAWLGLTHQEFSQAIGMDKSSLSRALRADSPRKKTLGRIALGLGISEDALLDSESNAALTVLHPALPVDFSSLSSSERVIRLQRWVQESIS